MINCIEIFRSNLVKNPCVHLYYTKISINFKKSTICIQYTIFEVTVLNTINYINSWFQTIQSLCLNLRKPQWKIYYLVSDFENMFKIIHVLKYFSKYGFKLSLVDYTKFTIH